MTKPPRPPTHRANSRFTEIAFLKPWSSAARVSHAAWAGAEIPAANMHATAEGLARIVHPLALGGGGRMTAAAVAAALRIRIKGPDLVLPMEAAWAAGLMANTEGQFGPEPLAFGHAGFGGAAVAIDPARRLSFAYTPTKMSPSLVGDSRFIALADALYADL
jgi:CubicO group peptidase (beta-lactamase class C family)